MSNNVKRTISEPCFVFPTFGHNDIIKNQVWHWIKSLSFPSAPLTPPAFFMIFSSISLFVFYTCNCIVKLNRKYSCITSWGTMRWYDFAGCSPLLPMRVREIWVGNRGGVQRGENGRLISTKGKKKFDLGRNVKIESDFGTALKSHNLRL